MKGEPLTGSADINRCNVPLGRATQCCTGCNVHLIPSRPWPVYKLSRAMHAHSQRDNHHKLV